MKKCLKKNILSALISAGLVATSTSALGSNAVQADLCFSYKQSIDATFKCNKLFNGNNLTIDEIYSRGYKAVSLSRNSNEVWILLIEKK